MLRRTVRPRSTVGVEQEEEDEKKEESEEEEPICSRLRSSGNEREPQQLPTSPRRRPKRQSVADLASSASKSAVKTTPRKRVSVEAAVPSVASPKQRRTSRAAAGAIEGGSDKAATRSLLESPFQPPPPPPPSPQQPLQQSSTSNNKQLGNDTTKPAPPMPKRRGRPPKSLKLNTSMTTTTPRSPLVAWPPSACSATKSTRCVVSALQYSCIVLLLAEARRASSMLTRRLATRTNITFALCAKKRHCCQPPNTKRHFKSRVST